MNPAMLMSLETCFAGTEVKPSHAMLPQAKPCYTMLCHVTPSHATPCHATPYHTATQHKLSKLTLRALLWYFTAFLVSETARST